MTSAKCLLCEASLEAAPVVCEVARYDERQHNVACERCGLVQESPVPSDAELDAYYAGPYRERFKPLPFAGLEPGTPAYEETLTANTREYASVVTQTLALERARVLEVGCAEGRLSAALAAEGHDVTGIDMDPGQLALAEARGVSTRQLSLASLHAERASHGEFAAVVAVHVLEHLRDPLGALADMRELLADGGRVWLEVPNTDSPYGDLSHYFQRPHLYNFTRATLAALLARAGFDGVQVCPSGHVLYAWATSNRVTKPRSYQDALQEVGVTPVAGSVVAQQLCAYQARRDANPGLKLQAWLSKSDDQDWLRAEFARMAGALDMVQQSLGQLALDLDALSVADAESWRDDPWQYGYLCGKARQAQMLNVIIGHLANSLVARAVKG